MTRHNAAHSIGCLANEALTVELELDPKPGLVTPRSRGSHQDMNHATFAAGIAALATYFADCAALGPDAGFEALRIRGLAAEGEMLAATGGVNTHRGAIFTLGLLCAAAGWQLRHYDYVIAGSLGQLVRHRWGEALGKRPAPPDAAPSHGQEALRRHGIPGARQQAAAGFPVLFEVALPALRQGLIGADDRQAACVHTLLSSIAALPDTNLVHRGGPDGLAWAQHAAAKFVAAGGVFAAGWQGRFATLCTEFEVRRLSPGGSADLLAAAWFLDRLDAEFPAPRHQAVEPDEYPA